MCETKFSKRVASVFFGNVPKSIYLFSLVPILDDFDDDDDFEYETWNRWG